MTEVTRREFLKMLGAGAGLSVLGAVGGASFFNKVSLFKQVSGQSAGSWAAGPATSSVPIHSCMTPDGKIFYIAGSGYHSSFQGGPFEAKILDPDSGSETNLPLSEDLFCAGHAPLPNGNILVAGGTLLYDTAEDNCNGKWHGLRAAYEFDWSAGSLTKIQDMRHGRWYPTCVTLADGNVMVTAGYDEYGDHNRIVEIYDSSSKSWTIKEAPSGGTTYTVGGSATSTCAGAGEQSYSGSSVNLFLYPRMHLMPSGNVVVAGMLDDIRLWNHSTGSWSRLGASSPYYRHYGTSVLLPLNNSPSEEGKILIVGGSPGAAEPATRACQILDFNAGNPQVRNVDSLQYGRKFLAPVILPDGMVVVFGGAAQGNDNPRYVPEMFDPGSETWTSLAAANVPRVYHQVSLLLPDGRVWTASSTPVRSVWELRTEFFRPGYYFANRPSISGAPTVGDYGESISISSPDVASISHATLVTLPNTTHHYDPNMRCLILAVQSSTSGSLTVEAPVNANLAPPGYYYIHVINNSGIPSSAKIVRIPGSGTGDDGGGGGTPASVFYDVAYPGNAAGVLYAGGNTRYGEEARTSSSSLVGKSLKSWKVYLRRVGSTSGSVGAKVRRTSDDSIAATFAENIDAAGLTTSFSEHTFTLATAHTIQVGDRILIEYSGPGRLEISLWTTDQVDGSSTRRTRYAGGAYAGASTVDIAGTMSSEGTTSGDGGGTGTPNVIYDVPAPGNAVGPIYSGTSIRYGEEARNSSSSLVGRSLRTWKVRLRKVGSPTGVVNATIRRASGDSIAASFGEEF
ncbi:MAG TPA: galactose oxidase-like domain-containing protein, partial [Nitrososphaera sp.]|nr:galactose oxidase-like domain-containing protein [Nitrososphaera sp.]